ncbi:MAG: histidinol-phosphate transaminase [Chitinivibrionales bacterium]|nr:histidinol-phosphate transaminase [Chitinivibrionales bacterium]
MVCQADLRPGMLRPTGSWAQSSVHLRTQRQCMKLDDALQLVNKSVRDLHAYHLEPVPATVKLNQNENPYDWPADIKEEMAAFCRGEPWNRYPAFVPSELKAALAEYVGVAPEGVIAGNGSNEILMTTFISLVDRARPVILCQPTFTVYELLVRALGGSVDAVPLRTDDLAFDVDAICAACERNRGSLLVLCSPNNPTGSSLDEARLRRILSVHKGMVLLDQAYVEFGGFDAVALLGEYPNLLITRTFSKAFAGAGLRLGYLIGAPALIREINKAKLPYNLNLFADHIARLLLRNRARIADRIAELVAARDRTQAWLAELPLDRVYPSDANFILIRTGRKEPLMRYLVERGILVRDVSKYPMLDNCLRIGIGTPDENDALRSAFESFFERTPT